jgi:rubrerythrin
MTPVHPDTLAALTAGIQSEVASYVFYLEAAKKTVAAEHKDILEKLALEEKDHFHILERQYDSLVRSEKWISTADILKQEGLPEITEEMSQEHRELIDEVSGADSLDKILDIAYRLEEDAHNLFASAIKTVQTDEGRKMFTQLSKFEEGHMKMIADMKASLS